jgi:hypothetical protein
MAPLLFEFNYWNLKHSPIQINMQNFALNYTKMLKDNEPVVFFELPLVNHWGFTLDYEARFGFFPR